MKKFFAKFFNKKNKVAIEHEKLVEVNDDNSEERMDIIIAFAKEYSVPILVGSQERVDQYREKTDIIVVGFTPKFTKHVLENTVLVNGVIIDETVLPQMEVILKENNVRIRGGFIKRGQY